jgi:hypothetical protein
MLTPGEVVYRETCMAVNALGRAGEAGEETLSASDVATLLRIARRHKQCTDRLHRIYQGKPRTKIQHTRVRYLEAVATRVCATVRAFAKTRRLTSLSDIEKFARRLSIWEVLSEPVRVKLLAKPKGGHRVITRDGARRMAQRFILRDLLTAAGVDSDCDYARPGAGGEKKMIEEVCQRIMAGYRHWQTADIKECFASLKPGHLNWLPLPKKLIRNVVFLPRCAHVGIAPSPGAASPGGPVGQGVVPGGISSPYTVAIQSATERVRRELPQGSVLSPLVARAFVGRELRAVLGPQEVARCSFVDDLIIGARNHPTVARAIGDLGRRLSEHPAGPISLHIDPPTSTSQGRVKVFGYVLQPGRGYGSNPIHVCPDRERFERFHKRLYERWKAEDQPNDADALEAFILDRLGFWMPSQQAWTVVPAYSLNLALTRAFLYVCEREAAEGS